MTQTDSVLFVVPGDDPPQIQGSDHLEKLDPFGSVVVHTDRPADNDEKIARVIDAHIILNTRGAVNWTGDDLRKLPNLKMIATCSIGTDMIDLEVASELGIVVSNQPGRTAPSVAEHIFGLMFAVAKRAGYQTAEVKAGRWAKVENIFLQGKTLGIVGTGAVGGELARLANAIGMKVIAWTFNPSDERAKRLGVEYVSMDELLAGCDVLSLNVAGSPETRGMIGRAQLESMKPGSLLINGGRGELVDTEALADVLNSGHLAGAAIDVFDIEPVSPDNPLLSCEQIVFTPHMADMTPEGVEALNVGVVENVIAFLEGNPKNVVTG